MCVCLGLKCTRVQATSLSCKGMRSEEVAGVFFVVAVFKDKYTVFFMFCTESVFKFKCN